jgi:hypothetical protein
VPEKYPGEYAKALAWLAEDADAAALARDPESQLAMLGLAEDLLQHVHWALLTIKHAPVDDTMPTPIRAIRAKLNAQRLDDMLDTNVIHELRAFKLVAYLT